MPCRYCLVKSFFLKEIPETKGEVVTSLPHRKKTLGYRHIDIPEDQTRVNEITSFQLYRLRHSSRVAELQSQGTGFETRVWQLCKCKYGNMSVKDSFFKMVLLLNTTIG